MPLILDMGDGITIPYSPFMDKIFEERPIHSSKSRRREIKHIHSRKKYRYVKNKNYRKNYHY